MKLYWAPQKRSTRALVDGDVHMSESAAICLYLADRYCAGKLSPAVDDAEWILGDEFSAADVMLGSSAVFLQMFGMMPESLQLKGYADRCLARKAYKKAVDLSK